MAEHKQKRPTENITEVDTEEHGFLLEPTQVELGAGYTLQVKYDENENPIVSIKTYGNVNMNQLKKEIQKAYPNARILQLNQSPQPVIVSKKHKKPKTKKKHK
ncbi:MAG: hypothetical protein QHH18_06805 [Candidatus Bathyarchaeota archaeon]|jgi:hypothetical protein|nr:hypothetical protein [Candidatus Bathyarchaeota archaeon A05DMB-5]MDH7558291.1 hypothetical protein [Candidatus Bathyarchaeota archaeon]